MMTKKDYKMIRNSKELMEVINQSGRLSDLFVKPLDDDQTVLTPMKSLNDTEINKEDHKTRGIEELSTPFSPFMAEPHHYGHHQP